jgi:mono/diheme cytochrome c family protein
MKYVRTQMLVWAGRSAAALLFLMTSRATHAQAPAAPGATETEIERGRYLISVGGCNDCHTPGFMVDPFAVPESEWLTGVPVGWRGPWGTTYAANLRRRVQEMSEQEWVTLLKTRKAMPPMPWFSVSRLKDADSRAVYHYIRSLGPKGEHVPKYLPPQQDPATPYMSLDLQHAPTVTEVKELRMERPPTP